MTILEVNNLEKRFGKLVAVKDISVTIPEGQIRGLIGPNGSGKTTTFHLISGFLKPTSGEVKFRGARITGKAPHRIAKKGLVRTFQLTSVYRDMSVRENVHMGHHIHAGRAASEIEENSQFPSFSSIEDSTSWILEFMDLSGDSEAPARMLPAGMQRVLSIATALAVRPKLLMLDEPLAGLNPTEKSNVAQKISSLRDRGITILLVEHDVRSVLSICDQITVINFGEKIAEGNADEITSNPAVIEAYLGKAEGHNA